MKTLIIGLLGLLFGSTAHATIIISEYVDGTGKNQAIELYNTGPTAVDLASWTVDIYQNGSSSPDRSFDLSGTIAVGGVFVLARKNADPAILAVTDQIFNNLNFDGNDALVLMDGGIAIDRVGQTGFDPGTEWGTGLVSTANNTMRRNSNILVGDANISAVFDPSVEWQGFAVDTFDGLGSHMVVPESPTGTLLLLGLVPLSFWRRRLSH